MAWENPCHIFYRDNFILTLFYDREEAVAKANALNERNAKEKKQYLLEISELSRIIRHEEKLLK